MSRNRSNCFLASLSSNETNFLTFFILLLTYFTIFTEQKRVHCNKQCTLFLLYQFLIQEILSDEQQLTILWQSPKLIGYEKFEFVYLITDFLHLWSYRVMISYCLLALALRAFNSLSLITLVLANISMLSLSR